MVNMRFTTGAVLCRLNSSPKNSSLDLWLFIPLLQNKNVSFSNVFPAFPWDVIWVIISAVDTVSLSISRQRPSTFQTPGLRIDILSTWACLVHLSLVVRYLAHYWFASFIISDIFYDNGDDLLWSNFLRQAGGDSPTLPAGGLCQGKSMLANIWTANTGINVNLRQAGQVNGFDFFVIQSSSLGIILISTIHFSYSFVFVCLDCYRDLCLYFGYV